MLLGKPAVPDISVYNPLPLARHQVSGVQPWQPPAPDDAADENQRVVHRVTFDTPYVPFSRSVAVIDDRPMRIPSRSSCTFETTKSYTHEQLLHVIRSSAVTIILPRASSLAHLPYLFQVGLYVLRECCYVYVPMPEITTPAKKRFASDPRIHW